MHSDPIVSFNLFGKQMEITLYGIFLSLGLVACLLVYKFFTDYRKIRTEVQDFGFITAICAIALGFLAAALFQSVYNYIENGYWEFGAITAMGGFIGGAAAYIAIYFGVGKFYFRGKKAGIHVKEFNKILLVAPCCITIAHAFGRIGCLMAGCCHGAQVSGPGQGGLYMPVNGGYYIPTQLYEAIFLFILFGVLTWMYYKRYNLTHVVYLIAYGVWRFIIEFFRTDDRGAFIGSISPSQFQSIVFVLGGIALFLFLYFKKYPMKLPPDEDWKKNKNENAPDSSEKPTE